MFILINGTKLIDLTRNKPVVLREPVANEIKYLSNKSNDQNDQSKSK